MQCEVVDVRRVDDWGIAPELPEPYTGETGAPANPSDFTFHKCFPRHPYVQSSGSAIQFAFVLHFSSCNLVSSFQ